MPSISSFRRNGSRGNNNPDAAGERTMMASKKQPTFSFGASSSEVTGGRGRKSKAANRHRRTHSEDMDNTDGAGSLTYSATSSVQSGGSAAGESTDSSFADIMRVLDMQDSQQLKDFIKKEGCTSVDELQKKKGWSGGMSVASSLAYSSDGESHLQGTKLLQTIAGQPSDSYGFDGGSATMEDEKMDLLFAPAAPAIVKKTKGNKVVLGKDKMTTKRNSRKSGSSKLINELSTPRASSNSSYSTPEQPQRRRYSPSPSSSTKSTPTKSPPSDMSGTPPLPTRKHFTKDGYVLEEEDDVWYKEWWMSCFPDTFKNLMPKR